MRGEAEAPCSWLMRASTSCEMCATMSSMLTCRFKFEVLVRSTFGKDLFGKKQQSSTHHGSLSATPPLLPQCDLLNWQSSLMVNMVLLRCCHGCSHKLYQIADRCGPLHFRAKRLSEQSQLNDKGYQHVRTNLQQWRHQRHLQQLTVGAHHALVRCSSNPLHS